MTKSSYFRLELPQIRACLKLLPKTEQSLLAPEENKTCEIEDSRWKHGDGRYETTHAKLKIQDENMVTDG